MKKGFVPIMLILGIIASITLGVSVFYLYKSNSVNTEKTLKDERREINISLPSPTPQLTQNPTASSNKSPSLNSKKSTSPTPATTTSSSPKATPANTQTSPAPSTQPSPSPAPTSQPQPSPINEKCSGVSFSKEVSGNTTTIVVSGAWWLSVKAEPNYDSVDFDTATYKIYLHFVNPTSGTIYIYEASYSGAPLCTSYAWSKS